MTFKVRLLTRAQGDADQIYLWLRQRSPQGAASWYAALLRKIDDLAVTPMACSFAPEARPLDIQLRQAFFKTRRGRTYRLLFVIVQNEVRIMRVRGPGQRPITRSEVPQDEP
jgi:plasmid stabilization system protein ParE